MDIPERLGRDSALACGRSKSRRGRSTRPPQHKNRRSDSESDPITVCRRVNLAGTAKLSRQAASAGVRRFVFVSSIKVNGEATPRASRFRADDPPAPQDTYRVSKYEGEEGLKSLARETGMEVVMRPPLVYGPGVKANFRSMMRWLARGVPLPLGAVRGNRRSLVALDNLVDFLIVCANHPYAANKTFLVSDGQDLSTADLLRRIASAMGTHALLLPVPEFALRFGLRLLGKSEVSRRLCDSLQVDIKKSKEMLAWKPPVSVDEGLAHAVSTAFALATTRLNRA